MEFHIQKNKKLPKANREEAHAPMRAIISPKSGTATAKLRSFSKDFDLK